MLKAVASGTSGGVASGITIGTTTITGGTTLRLLYDLAGVVSETANWTYTAASGLLQGTATSAIAIGGATISTNALAITGTSAFGGAVNFGVAGVSAGSANFNRLSDGATLAAISGSSGQGNFRTLTVGAGSDVVLSGPTTANLQFGNPDAAVAVAQTTKVQSVVAGTAAANGANWTLIGSLPTGTGTSGDIIFQTGVKTGSGTTQGTPTTALTIKGETQAITIASGKSLVLGNSATTGLTPGVLAASTNASIVITDFSGQAYRIPCII